MCLYRLLIVIAFMFSGVIFSCRISAGEASAVVSSNRVSEDEVFNLQIQVDTDSGKIVPPDMGALTDFKAEYLGASRSSSITVEDINGQSRRVMRNTAILNYKLMPLKKGRLLIPGLKVETDGKSYTTEPITILVSEAKPEDKMSLLEYRLPKEKVYLGETVPLELVWYFRNNPQLNAIEIPAFSDDRFVVSKITPPAKHSGNQRYVELMINGGKYWALQGEKIVNGVAYATITIKWYITPKETGKLTVKPAEVVASYVVGYKESSMFQGVPRGFSSMFDDSFFTGREPVVKQMVTRTAPLNLNIQPLPLKGRPENFSGVISPVKLGVEASSESAAVGEPIEVDLFASGSDNIYNMKLPDFNRQNDIMGKFKVTVDEGAGSIVGDMRKFKLIFRALSPTVKAIPPLRVAYYDPKASEYKEAKTWELPVSISAAKMVTAKDIESSVTKKVEETPLKENRDGIYANVTSYSVLENQDISVGSYLADNKVFFAIFPGCYVTLLLGQILVSRRKSSAGGRAAGKAVKVFANRVNSLAKSGVNADNLTDAIIEYYKLKSQTVDREWTLSEVYAEFSENRNIQDDTLANLKKIVDYCEACCYTGGAQQVLSPTFVESVKAVISRLDVEIG